MNRDSRIVEVESFSTPGVRYEVDLFKKTCSCPAFKKGPGVPCKHLRSFEGLFQQPAEPDPNEALSALIKSIRLRRPEDAVTWLLYLWRIPQYRGRAQRRVLIASAEDNLSVGVMRRVSAWFNAIERVRFESAVTEVVRICSTPNWWAQEEGRTYIRAWLSAERSLPRFELVSESNLYTAVESAAKVGDVQAALEAFSALYARQRIVPHRVSELLNSVAFRSESLQAKRLAALYQANLRTVGADSNLAGQAVYAALIGRFGDQTTPEPDPDEIRRLIATARENLAASPRVPNWALDGVHTGRFKDGRFAGTCVMMAACCGAYEHFGRLSIDDRWPSSFAEPR